MNLYDDKVLRFLDACYEAGIKRPEQYLISKMPQAYNWLKGCFPRGILPTDVDGEVEISGNFLRLEFKHENALRNGAIPKGQMMLLTSLANTGVFTVVIIGTSDDGLPTCYEAWLPNGKHRQLTECNQADIKELCQKWSVYAERNKS